MSTLHAVLARAPHVLLDFDGPVCAVFGGTSDRAVADLLRIALGERARELPPAIVASTDPFDVLRFVSSTLSSAQADEIERLFTTLEVAAMPSAPATPGAREAITALHVTGHTVTVVSNNSEAAVTAYLDAHGMSSLVTGVAARTDSSPSRLKPHPYLVRQAVHSRRARPHECALIGDSDTDVQASHAAGVASIAYANKPGKRAAFARLAPAAIIEDMTEIVHAARANPSRARQRYGTA